MDCLISYTDIISPLKETRGNENTFRVAAITSRLSSLIK